MMTFTAPTVQNWIFYELTWKRVNNTRKGSAAKPECIMPAKKNVLFVYNIKERKKKKEESARLPEGEFLCRFQAGRSNAQSNNSSPIVFGLFSSLFFSLSSSQNHSSFCLLHLPISSLATELHSFLLFHHRINHIWSVDEFQPGLCRSSKRLFSS